MLSIYDANLSTCHGCQRSESKQPGWVGGDCACTIDGVSIESHALRGDCAEGRFTQLGVPATRPSPARAADATAPAGERKPCCGQKILNGVVGLAKVAAQAVGIPLDQAPRDMEASRFRICTGCAPGAILCPDCDCIIKAKVRIKSEKCPRGKWPDVT